jgi:transposase
MTLSASDINSVSSGNSKGNERKTPGPRAGQATRRIFTAAYKLAIVNEYDSLTVQGSRGALLRREGLYNSHVMKWRQARDSGALTESPASSDTSRPLNPVKKSASATENQRLVAENARLTAELARSKSVVEVMGKLHALLENLSESAGYPPKLT